MAIRRGVTFYSFQDSYYQGNMNLEDCVRFVSEELHATGIELMVEQTPISADCHNPTDREVEHWKELMAKYGTVPTCMDAFVDTMLYKGRILTKKEQLQQFERDIRVAAKFGFDNIRVLCPLRAEVVEAAVPIAETYGVRMGLEIHQPMHFEAAWVQRFLEMCERVNSPYVGITPDFGIFMYKPNDIAVKNALKQGGDPKIIDFILNEFEKDSTAGQRILPQVQAMGGGPVECGLVMRYSRLHYNDPEYLRKYSKYLIHFHAKFYEMDPETLTETAIDYENPIRVLKEIGWNGSFSSEFEGQPHYWNDADLQDTSYELEELKLQHKMLQNLLGDFELV